MTPTPKAEMKDSVHLTESAGEASTLPEIVRILADWEDANGCLAAIMYDEWIALYKPITEAAVAQSPRMIREEWNRRAALASQAAHEQPEQQDSFHSGQPAGEAATAPRPFTMLLWSEDRDERPIALINGKCYSNAEVIALHEEVSRLLAAPGPSAQPWQPISTAPKDGSVVLLWTPMWRGKLADALPLAGYWLGSFWVIVNADAAIQRVEPTHWQALPPPPVDQGEQQ